MEINTINIVKMPELEHLISKSGGGTWRLLYDVFYYTRLFKYIHKLQYPKIRSALFKVTADWKLKELCERGYLFSPSTNVYCAKNKVLPILKEAGYLMILPDEPAGKGNINEINNTDVFIRFSKEKYFFTFLYPNFEYLIPDALLVEKKNNKYRLTCLEIEAKKPKWKEYIEGKKENYKRLAIDAQFYDWWCVKCKDLGFRQPTKDEFKFNYKIIKNE